MAKVRYVIMVPTVVEANVIGSADFIAERGRQIADAIPTVEAGYHTVPNEDGYSARIVEACWEDNDEHPIDINELVAPGNAA